MMLCYPHTCDAMLSYRLWLFDEGLLNIVEKLWLIF